MIEFIQFSFGLVLVAIAAVLFGCALNIWDTYLRARLDYIDKRESHKRGMERFRAPLNPEYEGEGHHE